MTSKPSSVALQRSSNSLNVMIECVVQLKPPRTFLERAHLDIVNGHLPPGVTMPGHDSAR